MTIIADLARRLGRLERWARLHGAYEPSNSTCHVARLNSSQSVAHNSATTLQYDTVIFNPDDLYAAGSPDRMTIAVAGVYVVTSYVLFAGAAGGVRQTYYTVDGAVVRTHKHAASGNAMSFGSQLLLTEGSLLRLGAYQDSGGAINVTKAYFEATRIA